MAMVAPQKHVSERWGCLDGKSGQRMLALLRGEKLPPAHAFAQLERVAAAKPADRTVQAAAN